MITIAFFNNKGGVGKTSLVYHLARMFGELGCRVLAADLDPQANLSIMALNEERLGNCGPIMSIQKPFTGLCNRSLAGPGISAMRM